MNATIDIVAQLNAYIGDNIYQDVIYGLMDEADHDRQDQLDPEGRELYVIGGGDIYRWSNDRGEWTLAE